MDSQNHAEGEHRNESMENEKYREFQSALEEEERLLGEIKAVFSGSLSQEEAQAKIMQEYAPQFDEALARTGKALDAWLESMPE